MTFDLTNVINVTPRRAFDSKQINEYIPDPGLLQAVQVAITLNKPLLLSGEPGTGKTELAYWLARTLSEQTSENKYSFLADPFVFNTKSTSVATDLFYFYDAVSHFRYKPGDGQSDETGNTSSFIQFRALGEAFVAAIGDEGMRANYPGLNISPQLSNRPRSSVVLIDEIDKAPREFPNDILNELEEQSFRIHELSLEVERRNPEAKVLIIFTSNMEKSLPQAFMRRCVFYHINFPSTERLLEILLKRIQNINLAPEKLEELINIFVYEREQAKADVRRKPSTAEFLDWMQAIFRDSAVKDWIGSVKKIELNGSEAAQRFRNITNSLVNKN